MPGVFSDQEGKALRNVPFWPGNCYDNNSNKDYNNNHKKHDHFSRLWPGNPRCEEFNRGRKPENSSPPLLFSSASPRKAACKTSASFGTCTQPLLKSAIYMYSLDGKGRRLIDEIFPQDSTRSDWFALSPAAVHHRGGLLVLPKRSPWPI